MNLRRRAVRDDPEINFIPLIDVLLVILIFLMVTTTYQRVAELQITLPEAEADQAKQRPKEVNVGIDAQGRTFTEGIAAEQPELGSAVGDVRQAAGRRQQLRASRRRRWRACCGSIGSVTAASMSGTSIRLRAGSTGSPCRTAS